MLNSLKGSVSNLLNKINLCGGNNDVGTAHVPQKYKIGNRVIQEERLISEGGYGYVWECHDVGTKQKFAVKKMLLQSSEAFALAQKEIDVLRKLPDNAHIVGFYDATIVTFEDRQTRMAIILLELCSEGSLLNYVLKRKENPLEESEIIMITSQIVKALVHLHSQDPPIAHRDIKLENVLIKKGVFKVCDFGSCSTLRTEFNEINRKDFYQYEEVYEKNTTLMYRPPEMIELYLKFAVNEKVDIWMLGCIFYVLLFYRHPFEDASKLSIVSCAYRIPKIHKYSPEIIQLLSLMLVANPDNRISAFELDSIFIDYNQTKKLKIPVEFLEKVKEEIIEEKPMIPKSKSKTNTKKENSKQPLMDASNEWGEFMKASMKKPSFTLQNRYYQEENLDFNSFAVEKKPPLLNQWGTSGSFINTFNITMPASPKMEDIEEKNETTSQKVPYFSMHSLEGKNLKR